MKRTRYFHDLQIQIKQSKGMKPGLRASKDRLHISSIRYELPRLRTQKYQPPILRTITTHENSISNTLLFLLRVEAIRLLPQKNLS